MEQSLMSGRRIAFLFLYAFASMTLPVLVPLALMGARGQISIERASFLWSAFAYAAYGLIQIFLVFPVIGSWAAAVEPQTRVRVSSQELKQTLLSLNDERLPFAVLRDSGNPDRLVASWKIADEKWTELFAARRLRIQYELRMKILDGKGIVLAQDNLRRFEYTSGASVGGIKFNSRFSFFKGISLLQYGRGVQYGVVYKDGKLKIDYAYNYKFQIDEVKNPIVQVVTGSGWEFRPTVFLMK